ERVAINRLEEIDGLVAHKASFNSLVPCDLALHPKAPGVYLVGSEVLRNVGLIESARVENPRLEKWGQLRANGGPGRHGRQPLRAGAAHCKASQEDHRS